MISGKSTYIVKEIQNNQIAGIIRVTKRIIAKIRHVIFLVQANITIINATATISVTGQ